MAGISGQQRVVERLEYGGVSLRCFTNFGPKNAQSAARRQDATKEWSIRVTNSQQTDFQKPPVQVPASGSNPTNSTRRFR